MAKVNERFGRIDTLFVNAGVTSNGPTPVAMASEDEFDRVFAINTKGGFFTVQKTLPYMPKGSTIVFCTSIVDRLGVLGPGGRSHRVCSPSAGPDRRTSTIPELPVLQTNHHDIASAACLAHCQNFSAAIESGPRGAAMPKISGFGSGVRRRSFTRLPAE